MATTAAPLHGEILPIELMNTIWADRDGVHDALATPAEAFDWIDAAHGPSPKISADGAAEVRALRDALRRLAAEAAGDDRAAGQSPLALSDAVGALNRASERGPAWSQLRWQAIGSPQRTIHSNADALTAKLAEIAEHGIELFSGPDRDELRACHAPGCVLYFLRDHSRREWCSAGCGNRARVARHYQRHHG